MNVLCEAPGWEVIGGSTRSEFGEVNGVDIKEVACVKICPRFTGWLALTGLGVRFEPIPVPTPLTLALEFALGFALGLTLGFTPSPPPTEARADVGVATLALKDDDGDEKFDVVEECDLPLLL